MMEAERDSFLLYKSFYGPIKKMSDEQLGHLFRALYEYQINGEVTHDSEIEMAFGFFVNQFEIDNRKWLERCLINRENGKKGGRPKKTNRFIHNQTVCEKAKKADNDNDNVSNMKSRDLILPFNSREFVNTWKELRSQPKWKRKPMSALQKSLDQLGKYQEEYAIILMDQAIANNYQGVVFPNTSAMYETWKKNNPGQTQSVKVLNVEDLL